MEIGGAEGQIIELIRRLPAERFDQRLVLLQKGGPLIDRARATGCEIFELDFRQCYHPYDPRFYLEFIRVMYRYTRLLRAFRPDVLHAQLFWANIISAVAGRLAGVPAVLTSRLQVAEYREKQPWKRTLENLTNPWTKGVFINSEAMRVDTLENEKIDPKIIHLIYNGVVLDRFDKADPSGPRREFGIQPQNTVLVFVANLHHYKGHADLVKAVSLLVPRWPDLRVLLPGRDQGTLETLKTMIRDLKLEKNVLLLGERKDIPDIWALADIGVHPSYREGFSNAILEGMASAKPMVVSNKDGNPEAVRDGLDGFVFPLGDSSALAAALEKLIADETLRHTMGRSARRRVEEEFTMDIMIQHFAEWYESFV